MDRDDLNAVLNFLTLLILIGAGLWARVVFRRKLVRMEAAATLIEKAARECHGALAESHEILAVAKGNEQLAHVKRDDAIGALGAARKVAEEVQQVAKEVHQVVEQAAGHSGTFRKDALKPGP